MKLNWVYISKTSSSLLLRRVWSTLLPKTN
ncbi:hypothetical protein OIU84_012141, partial [Salix udensis]